MKQPERVEGPGTSAPGQTTKPPTDVLVEARELVAQVRAGHAQRICYNTEAASALITALCNELDQARQEIERLRRYEPEGAP